MLEICLIIALLAAAVFFGFALLLKNWRWLPVVLLVILFFLPRQTVPGGILENYVLLRWLSVILIPVVFIVQAIRMMIRKEAMQFSPVLWPLSAIVLLYGVSAVINNARIIDTLGSMMLYVRYPILFIAVLNMKMDDVTVKKLIVVFAVLVTLQVPECAYRYFVLGIHGDFISWTLGPWGAFDLGVYIIYAGLFVIALGIKRGIRWWQLVYILALFIVSLFGEIKAVIVALPVACIFTFITVNKDAKLQKRVAALAVPLFIVFMLIIVFRSWSSVHTQSDNMLQVNIEKVLNVVRNPSLLFVEQEKLELSSSRIFGSVFIWNKMRSAWLTLLFGLGPGSMLAGNFIGAPGIMFDVPQYLNQISAILGEIGLLGLAGYVLLLIVLLLEVRKNMKRTASEQKKIVFGAWVGMWVYYTFLGPVYDLTWRHDSPNFMFYVFAAYLAANGWGAKESKDEHSPD